MKKKPDADPREKKGKGQGLCMVSLDHPLSVKGLEACSRKDCPYRHVDPSRPLPADFFYAGIGLPPEQRGRQGPGPHRCPTGFAPEEAAAEDQDGVLLRGSPAPPRKHQPLGRGSPRARRDGNRTRRLAPTPSMRRRRAVSASWQRASLPLLQRNPTVLSLLPIPRRGFRSSDEDFGEKEALD